MDLELLQSRIAVLVVLSDVCAVIRLADGVRHAARERIFEMGGHFLVSEDRDPHDRRRGVFFSERLDEHFYLLFRGIFGRDRDRLYHRLRSWLFEGDLITYQGSCVLYCHVARAKEG